MYVKHYNKDSRQLRETFIFTGFWQSVGSRFKCAVRCSNSTFLGLLLLMCGDVEPCPRRNQNTRFNPELKKLTSIKGVKIFHYNVRGLSLNFDHIVAMLKCFSNMDVVTLSETHLQCEKSDEDPEALYFIPGYSFVNKPRKSGKGGGVAAYISDWLTFNRRFDLENDEIECIWLQMKPRKSSSYLTGVIYRLPDSSKHLPKDFNNSFEEMLKKVCESSLETILLGDVNVNYLVSGDGRDFKSIVSSNGLKQIIRKATRICDTTKTLIDIIATSNISTIVNHGVISTGIGDHEMVGCVRKINWVKFKPRLIKCHDYRKYNPKEMSEDFRKQNWYPVLNSRNVNNAWNTMKNIMLEIFDKHAPRLMKKVKGKLAPWLTDDVKKLMNERDKLLRKARKSPDAEFYKAEYRQKRNAVNIAIRRANASYYNNLVRENSTGDPRKFWKTVKSIYPGKAKSSSSIQVFEIDGKTSTNQSDISNGFCSFFMNIIASLKQKSILLKNFAWQFILFPSQREQRTCLTFS